jgi:signal transduction histidine kinase
LILSFAYFAYFSFLDGVKVSLLLTMGELAKVEGVSNGNPVSVLAFSIASTWQDIPVDIQAKCAQANLQLNDVCVVATRDNIFSVPNAIFIISLFANEEGLLRFVSHSALINASGTAHTSLIFILAIIAIIIFTAVVMAILFYENHSVKHLRDWAKSLTATNLKLPPPDFNYMELNSLANIIHGSLNSVQTTLDREYHFLRNASHELRTPITVINSNLALLAKMKQANKSEQQQQVVLDRITRANSTMLHITETLLWLSREDGRSVSYQLLRLDTLVESAVDSLRYLLCGKQVSVQLETLYSELELPLGGCHIVLANLLRNAFQHTDNGIVTIKQGTNFISVRNVKASSRSHDQPISFGLGLKLINKLAKQFGWKYHCVIEGSGYYVEVHF